MVHQLKRGTTFGDVFNTGKLSVDPALLIRPGISDVPGFRLFQHIYGFYDGGATPSVGEGVVDAASATADNKPPPIAAASSAADTTLMSRAKSFFRW